MLKTFFLTATLSMLPLAAAAQDHDIRSPENTCIARVQNPGALTLSNANRGQTETMEAFAERMRAFGSQAGAVCADPRLNDQEKEARIATLWTQHQSGSSLSSRMAPGEQSYGTASAPNETTLIADYALSQANQALQQAATALASIATARPAGR